MIEVVRYAQLFLRKCELFVKNTLFNPKKIDSIQIEQKSTPILFFFYQLNKNHTFSIIA